MVTISHGAATDTGNLRSQNEDSYLITDRLIAVADGMGGHNAGEVASAMAVALLQERTTDAVTTVDAFVDVITGINVSIYNEATSAAAQRGMGTTLTAALMVTNDAVPHAIVANVGDSRTYLYREGELRQLSVDHSYVQELVTEGVISAEEARSHPRRNIVTRALGIEGDVNADSWVVPMIVGDRYVVCSDGLVDEVDDAELARIVSGNDSAEVVAQQLVDAANANGGRDNITVVVVDVVDDAVVTTPPTTTPPEVSATRGAKTKRRVLTVVAVVLLLSLGLGATAWWARDGYFVGFAGSGDDAELVVFKGQPRQVLWFSPTVRVRTGVMRSEVFPALANDIDKQPTYSSLAKARAFAISIRDVIAAQKTEPSDS